MLKRIWPHQERRRLVSNTKSTSFNSANRTSEHWHHTFEIWLSKFCRKIAHTVNPVYFLSSFAFRFYASIVELVRDGKMKLYAIELVLNVCGDESNVVLVTNKKLKLQRRDPLRRIREIDHRIQRMYYILDSLSKSVTKRMKSAMSRHMCMFSVHDVFRFKSAENKRSAKRCCIRLQPTNSLQWWFELIFDYSIFIWR